MIEEVKSRRKHVKLREKRLAEKQELLRSGKGIVIPYYHTRTCTSDEAEEVWEVNSINDQEEEQKRMRDEEERRLAAEENALEEESVDPEEASAEELPAKVDEPTTDPEDVRIKVRKSNWKKLGSMVKKKPRSLGPSTDGSESESIAPVPPRRATLSMKKFGSSIKQAGRQMSALSSTLLKQNESSVPRKTRNNWSFDQASEISIASYTPEEKRHAEQLIERMKVAKESQQILGASKPVVKSKKKSKAKKQNKKDPIHEKELKSVIAADRKMRFSLTEMRKSFRTKESVNFQKDNPRAAHPTRGRETICGTFEFE